MDPIDPVLLTPEARRALAARDIATVYRLLKDAGVSQRWIAELTGQSQSQVHDIVHGRIVKQYDVVVRIADGLGVDRAWLGVSHGPEGAYAEPVTRAEPSEGVTAEMKRRAFLAAVSTAVWGSPVLGSAMDLPTPHGAPGHLPGTLGMTDVAAVEDMTGHFRALARQYGGHAAIVSEAAKRSARLATVSATVCGSGCGPPWQTCTRWLAGVATTSATTTTPAGTTGRPSSSRPARLRLLTRCAMPGSWSGPTARLTMRSSCTSSD